MNHAITVIGNDILNTMRFREGFHVMHHRKHTVASHSIAVAESAYVMALALRSVGFSINEVDIVRAALLHDISMTNEWVYRLPSLRKCYLHPKLSAVIAQQEFHATPVQCDAVRHHMWPLCLRPPRHLVGWVVLAADRIVSIKEFFCTAQNVTQV